MAEIAFKLSTMVGEKFESFLPQMAEIFFKLSTMVGENFESFLTQMAKIAIKLSTMVSIKKIQDIPGHFCNFH